MKKITSILVTLAMMVSVLPTLAFAADSGNFGENITWTLDDNGTLVISGTGGIGAIAFEEKSPFDSNSNINSVVVENGITGIEDFAFYKCSGLVSVSLPDSVTRIGGSAFEDCVSLTDITIPDSVTYIGSSAFSGCVGLTDITIPDSVTYIADSAFSGCIDVKNIDVSENNKNYCSINGTLFSKDKTRLLRYAIGKGDTSYTIPDSVAIIGFLSFADCVSLTNITIPDSVTDIETSAFSGCSSLTAVTIPDSVTIIGGYAFEDCVSLTNITIPDSVTNIGSSTFSGCVGLTDITIPDSVTNIGSSAFSGCIGLKNIDVGENNKNYCSINGTLFSKDKTELLRYSMGKGDTSYTIPDSVKRIGDYAFSDYSILTDITIPDSVTYIGSFAFSGCGSLTDITIPDSVTYIGDWAFADCIELSSVTIPSSITKLEDYTFIGCHGLTNVTLPDTLTEIGCFAFSSCHALTSIVIPKNVTIMGGLVTGAVFQNCHSLTNITIPVGVTRIDDYTFYGCENLTDVYYGGNEEQWKNVQIGDENTVLANCTVHYNSSPISVLLNNETLSFDVMPQIINGSTMVPLRTIFEALGASVEWDGTTRTITSLKGDTRVKLTVDEDIMYINGNAVTLNASACIINDRTLVPVRAISEAYGAKVDWNSETRTVYISQ